MKILKQIDEQKAKIAAHRPLTSDEARGLNEYFKIGTTYSSNALEGNSLTISETKVLLEDGLTIGGKPLRDIYEAAGHADAFDFMLEAAKSGSEISEESILELHKLFYARINAEKAGVYRTEDVIISGTEYLPPSFCDVSRKMAEFVQRLSEKAAELHPVLLAAAAHRGLVDVHPFIDGNGRTARLLMNLVLIKNGYYPVSIPPILRNDYIGALRKSQLAGETKMFDTLIAECELEALRDVARLLRI